MARFENWKVLWRRNPLSKTGGFYSLKTDVFDDTGQRPFPDGANIITGPLSEIAEDESWVQTATSNGIKHILGKPAPNQPKSIALFVDYNQDMTAGRLSMGWVILSIPGYPS